MDNSTKETLTLSGAVEAILFYTAEPMSLRKLSVLTKSSGAEVKEAISQLRSRLEQNNSGIRVLELGDEVALGTTSGASSLIEEITREEITKELSRASLETLSIICYKGPLTRADIDYIRGVNSTFIIRNLLVRGIIEKQQNPRDARASLYAPTFAALEYMGVTRVEDLPQYEDIQSQLKAFAGARLSDDGEVVQVESGNSGEDMALHNAPLEDEDHSEEAESSNFEADIAEEQEMGESFDDSEIALHNAKDESVDSPS